MFYYYSGNLKLSFFIYIFFNVDISLNNIQKGLKLCVCILHNDMEGNFYLSPSFHFMKSRKN